LRNISRLKLQKLKFNVDVAGAFERHTAIILLISFSVVTRLLLIKNAPFVYFFDSYGYVSKALDFLFQGAIPFGVGVPFTLSLAAFMFAFGPILQPVLAARLLMLVMTSLTVCVTYLLGTRIVNKTFGFLAALLALFEPLFLTYSIVPHNDVFAVAMGLTAIYLATSNVRFSYALGAVFFYFTVLTRPEFFPILAIPILFFFTAKLFRGRSRKSLAKLGLVVAIYVLPSIWVYEVYATYTRFGLFERVNLFLTPDIFQFTLNFVFEFYDNVLLNNIFLAFVALGLILAFLTIAGQFLSLERTGRSFSINRKKDQRIRDKLSSDKTLIALCVFLVFLIDIVVLTVFSIGYTIVDGKVIITAWFPDRYMILSRLLVSYPLVYPLATIVQGVRARIGRQK
jgi:hypothetical protein